MLLPAKILRLFICLCFLFLSAQSVSAQDRVADVERSYEIYVEGLFKSYDKDRNGMLNADEVNGMRRKPSGADANGDGKISKDELLQSYIAKASLKRTGRRKDWAPKSGKKDSAPGKSKIVHGVMQIKKEDKQDQPELRDKVRVIQSDGEITLVGGNASDIAAVEALLAKLQEKGEQERGERKVELSVWVVKSSESFDANKFKGQSKESVSSQLSDLAKDSSVHVEEFQLETILERSFELTRGGQVPVVQGISVRGGQVTSQTSNYEVGTSLVAEATRDGKNVVIDFKIEKSTVEDSDVELYKYEDEVVYAASIQQFELEAEVECEPGKASVVQSKDGDRGWTLIFHAK